MHFALTAAQDDEMKALNVSVTRFEILFLYKLCFVPGLFMCLFY